VLQKPLVESGIWHIRRAPGFTKPPSGSARCALAQLDQSGRAFGVDKADSDLFLMWGATSPDWWMGEVARGVSYGQQREIWSRALMFRAPKPPQPDD